MVNKRLKEIRKDLDKNNDGLISLEEYLAEEESRGPKAKKGKISYDYQDSDNIVNYFLIVLRKLKKYKIFCVPNFEVRFKDYVHRTALVINTTTEEITYGRNMRESISNCESKKPRFIFFNMILRFKYKQMTHANMVVIDLKNKTLERFEPQGETYFFSEDSLEENEHVNNLIEKVVMKDLGLNNFKYISPKNISPFQGVQSHADAYCGMCVTISMMYLHLRILNPDIKQIKLVKFLINRPKEKLKSMILKYAKHVEETLKENEDYVLELFDEVIEELNL